MIKMTATGKHGRQLLVLGLSHANLDRLRADGTKGFIPIKGEEVGIPGLEVVITAGETEAAIESALRSLFPPGATVETVEKPEG